MKGKDSLILIRHNGATVAGAFDTDNYKHNTLAQMALVELEVGHQVVFSRNVDRDKYFYNATLFHSMTTRYATQHLLILFLSLQVWIEILSGGVRSNENAYVHFVGHLLHYRQ